ncbi:MAG: hypothetical protein E7619_06175 [Ruminococcaceae bacterium]|nr:hypothetical protein [Oscillospiraceae bacterium]
MHKVQLTEEIIRKDAVRYLHWKVDKKEHVLDMDAQFMLPLVLAPFLWIMFGWVFGVICIAVAVYMFIPYLKSRKRLKKEDDWADDVKFQISREKLVSVFSEDVYEPHYYGSGRNRVRDNYKTVYMLCFGVGEWRIPEENYPWAKDLRMTANGVENTSLPGDEFWVVRVNGGGEICVAYNTKFFKYTEKQKTDAVG